MDLPEITEAQRLDLRPGDRLVLRFVGRLTAAQGARIREAVQAWAGDGVPVLVLDDGASLEVVPADGEPPEIVR